MNIPKDNDALDGEAGLNKSFDDVYPNAVVKISRDQYSAFEMKRMVEETQELQLDPEFQRNQVWTNEQKRELIESLLMGIPIPVIYVFENEKGIKQIVDGRQRITTIIDFMNNRFVLKDLTMLSDFDGKSFNDLDPVFRSKLERYQLFVYVIEPPTPERVKYDIFDRVNRGGTQLNNQEMRNALYYGQATKLLKKLALTDEFLKATGRAISPKRMRDQYVIIRFIAFYLLRKKLLNFEYKSNLDDFLAAAMTWLNNASVQEINDLKIVFTNAMKASYDILGEDAFRFKVTNINRRPINMALFESIAYFFSIFDLSSINIQCLKIELDNLKLYFDDSIATTGRVDTSSGVNFRFSEVEALKERLSC